MAIIALVFTFILTGCSINADVEDTASFPSLDSLIDEDEEPYRFEIQTIVEDLEEPVVEYREASSVVQGGAAFIYAKTQDGDRGTVTKNYKLTFNKKDELLSKVELTDSNTIQSTQNTVYEGGQVAQAGAFFDATRITRYGADCDGCNTSAQGTSGTSAGIGLGPDSVVQKDGSWKQGLTYEGYYVLASDRSIPLCTVVEVSNHSISGAGISPGVPFKAIVLDRGGAIKGAKLDLFGGSERAPLLSTNGNRGARITILSLNSRYRSNGKWNCSI